MAVYKLSGSQKVIKFPIGIHQSEVIRRNWLILDALDFTFMSNQHVKTSRILLKIAEKGWCKIQR